MKFMEILLTLFGLVGAGVMLSSILQFYRAAACKKWLKTKGIITNTEIKFTGGYGGTSTGALQTKGSYLAIINYDFFVKDKKFSGNMRCFGDYGAGEERAKNIIKKYQKDQVVEVFYNPNNNSMAVLETDLRYGLLLAPFIGLVMVGVTVVYFYNYIRIG